MEGHFFGIGHFALTSVVFEIYGKNGVKAAPIRYVICILYNACDHSNLCFLIEAIIKRQKIQVRLSVFTAAARRLDNLLYAVDKLDSPLQLITWCALFSGFESFVSESDVLFYLSRSCHGYARAHTLHSLKPVMLDQYFKYRCLVHLSCWIHSDAFY